jgi:actin-related protein 9
MASIGFRDSNVVIIETSRSVIRDGLGLHERCVVGNPSSCRPPCPAPAAGGSGEAGPSMSNSRAMSAAPQLQSLKVTDYLFGLQLDGALAAGQEVTVSWPFIDGQIRDFLQQRCSGTSIDSTFLLLLLHH